jgi:hypothetical protein
MQEIESSAMLTRTHIEIYYPSCGFTSLSATSISSSSHQHMRRRILHYHQSSHHNAETRAHRIMRCNPREAIGLLKFGDDEGTMTEEALVGCTPTTNDMPQHERLTALNLIHTSALP